MGRAIGKMNMKAIDNILTRTSPIELIDPAFESINPLIGEWPIDVAIPFLPTKSNAITPQLLNGI